MHRPASDEFAPHFQAYVDRVPDGDVIATLERQGALTCALFGKVADQRADFCYAPGKWSAKRVLQHVVDGERMFAYRALCIARGETNSLPGFDENLYAENDGSEGRRLALVVAEFASVRAATMTLLRGFDGAAWMRRGVANGRPASVRSLPWIMAGHELHHLAILRERYSIA